MNQEIERLNENLRVKINENKNLEAKVSHYEYDTEASRKRQIDHFEMTITNLERRIADFQR